MPYTPTARIAATLLAVIAWTGLGLQLAATFHLTGSLPLTLWTVAAYFTITTNLLVALVFTDIAFTGIAIAPSRARTPSLLAATMLSILLVGVVYLTLLHGLSELSVNAALANTLLHMVTPTLVPLFWIAFAPKGHLTARDPLLWALYPLAYLAYALARGHATTRYAYPFLNLAHLGWPRTLLNATLIAIAFLLASYAVLWIDRVLTHRRRNA